MQTQKQFDMLKDYIIQQQEEFLSKEAIVSRLVPKQLEEDARVDVCIFFILPHDVCQAMVDRIASLSALVSVIPVIAKVCVSNPSDASMSPPTTVISFFCFFA